MSPRRVWPIVGVLAISAFCARGPAQVVDSATPAPAAEQTLDPMDAGNVSKLQASRESFVQSIKEGALVSFDEATGVVTFRPIKLPESTHEPGPMEDEVIASAVRAAIVSDSDLRGLKVKVECRGGALRLAENSAKPAQMAQIIQAALGVDGVREVCAELPRSLKLRPGV